jgi:hypothetical protein
MESLQMSTGRAATTAGVLMTIGVEGEWLLNPQRDDGTVSNMLVFALLLLAATAGFVVLLAAAHGLSRTTARRTRPARTGAALTVAGAGLLTLFATSALITAVLTGAPWEPTFLAFLIGMLLLAVGPVTWGISLRRQPSARGVWQMLVVAGVAAFAALAIEPDPWHDVSLVVMFAAWSVLGALLTRRSRAGERIRGNLGNPKSAGLTGRGTARHG